jgi:hypothetical protein
MFHLSEAFHARKSAIAEQPAPSEIGGYAFELDREFSSAFANAGGMQIQANLRGQVEASSGNYWTPLGIVRLARSGQDTLLGPSDGALTAETGVSFAPEFEENGRWIRMGGQESGTRRAGRRSSCIRRWYVARSTIVRRPANRDLRFATS